MTNRTVSKKRGETPPPPPSGQGNQLANPYFEGPHNQDPLVWEQTAGWDVSWKSSNPSPTLTAARLNDPAQAGEYVLGTHDRIWQVIEGRGPYLTMGMNGVQHNVSVAQVNIYGGDSGSGPWELVWTPFTLPDIPYARWGAYKQKEVLLSQGHAFYKVEFHGMYTSVQGGIKFTNAFFESR